MRTHHPTIALIISVASRQIKFYKYYQLVYRKKSNYIKCDIVIPSIIFAQFIVPYPIHLTHAIEQI